MRSIGRGVWAWDVYTNSDDEWDWVSVYVGRWFGLGLETGSFGWTLYLGFIEVHRSYAM